ncbi:MAG: hypothetical protein ACI8UO_000144 [Verrucomicrobiales bacterium]|jgi:hypothetical protein
MRKIYENIDFTGVGHFESVLKEAGIETLLKNTAASSTMGEVPFTEVYPELWVLNDEDYDRALEILKPYYEVMMENRADWVCANCKTEVEGTFGECWNCGRMRDEVPATS